MLQAYGGARSRVIDALRKLFPDVLWYWCGRLRNWFGSDGSYVYACAHLAPRFDGDDDSFVTVYYRGYGRGGPPATALHSWELMRGLAICA